MTENSDPAFHVFLCHNSADKPAVKQVALQLKAKGIRPWLDEWELQPGLPWHEILEAQIKSVKSAAVFVGPSGTGPWQDMELAAFIRQFVKRRCPVIPVLLPNVEKTPDLPIFLDGMTYIDLGRDESPFERLVWGITGKNHNYIPSEEAAAQMPELSLKTESPPKKEQGNDTQWTPSDLQDRVIKEVGEILATKVMGTVSFELAKILEVNPGNIKNLVVKLAEGNLRDRIQNFGNAIKGAAQKEADNLELGQWPFKTIQKKAIDVVGWLVLLSVDGAWARENRDLFKEGFPKIRIELGVKTSFGAGTAMAGLAQNRADFKLCASGETPFGGSLYKMDHVMEGGELYQLDVLELKKVLWAKFAPHEEVPQTFNADENAALCEWLRLSAGDGKHPIVTVDLTDTRNTVNWEAAFQPIIQELPNLNILFINGANPLIILNEIELNTAVKYFFGMLKETQLLIDQN